MPSTRDASRLGRSSRPSSTPKSEQRWKSSGHRTKGEFIYTWDGEPVHVPDLYVPEHVGTPTGLYDVYGDEILKPPRKIGFV